MATDPLPRKPRSPRRFLRTGRAPGTQTLVVCAGDSITHGVGSADYVAQLQADPALAGNEFVNAGWSGDLAWNLLRRLDDIIACGPDVVTVLIGTNDVAAHIDDRWRDNYMKRQHLPQLPTIEWYGDTLRTIVERLRTETGARIALIEIPVLGEDLTSVHNERVNTYNKVVHDVATAAGVPVLPLHERMVAALPAQPATPFDGTKKLMVRAVAARFLLRRSWNDISDRHELVLLTDHVHLNERASTLLTETVRDFLVPGTHEPT